MSTALRHPVLGFAHRGARALAPDNTLESFVLARRMGAIAVESDVWITRDGIAVLDHDGTALRAGRTVAIGEVDRRRLPAHIPSLDEFYATVGTEVLVSLDVKDVAAATETLRVAHRAGPGTVARTWLCHPDTSQLERWRSIDDQVGLVASVKRRALAPDRHADLQRLAAVGVDVVNLRGDKWTPALVRRCHGAGLEAFAWNVQSTLQMRLLLSWGVDAIYSDHVDRLVAVLGAGLLGTTRARRFGTEARSARTPAPRWSTA